jgi:deoxycytidylate deaminase
MPPCKRCFGALCAAGIKRIVSNKEYVKAITDGAEARKIGLVTSNGDFFSQQKDTTISELIKSIYNQHVQPACIFGEAAYWA